MTAALTTWSELGTVDGSALLIVNAAAGDEMRADEAFRTLSAQVAADALHVIAPPAWQRWLDERGQPADRVLICVDADGREVELTHFLHTSIALSWIGAREFQVITGTLPHKRYNDEVQEEFERRVCLFLGGGRFLAHTLPDPHIYVLDAPALVHRFGRSADVDRFLAMTRGLVADLHGQWLAAGEPEVNDTGRHDAVMAVVSRHLGGDVRGFDESPPPLPDATHRAEEEVASYLAELHATLCERDRRLAALEALLAERIEAVETRDRIIVEMRDERNEAVSARERIIQDNMAERNEAVEARDAIIQDLRAEMDRRLVRLALEITHRLAPRR